MPVKEGCCDWKEVIQGNEREMRPIIKAEHLCIYQRVRLFDMK